MWVSRKQPDVADLPALDVAIYVENLDGGGVQAMRLKIARELVARGRRVSLLVGEAKGALLAQVPSGVAVTELPPASRAATAAAALRAGACSPQAVLAATMLGHDADMALRHLPALARYLDAARPKRCWRQRLTATSRRCWHGG